MCFDFCTSSYCQSLSFNRIWCFLLALDATKVWATGRGIQPKGVRVGEDAVFQVHTEGAGDGEPRVMIMGPGGVASKTTVKKIGTTFEYVYKALKPGLYIINITFGGQPIQRSPFKVDVGVVKISKVRAYGPGLETGTVGVPALFTVEPNGEGPIGKLESVTDNVDVVLHPLYCHQ